MPESDDDDRDKKRERDAEDQPFADEEPEI